MFSADCAVKNQPVRVPKKVQREEIVPLLMGERKRGRFWTLGEQKKRAARESRETKTRCLKTGLMKAITIHI